MTASELERYIDKSKSCYSIKDIIIFNSDLYGETELYSADISKYGVNLRHSKNFAMDNDFSFIVRYRNGTQSELLNLYPADWSGGASGKKAEKLFALAAGDIITAFGLISSGTIDVKKVSAVVINGTEIPITWE